MKLKIVLIIFIIISGSASYTAENRITWEPVAGAWGYYLEIKDSGGNIILSTTVTDSFYLVSRFEPGAYSFRIATVNILKQQGESTPWIDFVIEKLYIPELKSVSKRELISSLKNKNIVVKGKNLKPGAKFYLRGNGKEIGLTDVKINSDSEAVFTVKPDASSKGLYDLVVINRGDAESVLKNAVVIVEPEEAETIWFAGAGYHMSMPVGPWSEYYKMSYTGAKIFFQYSGRNFGFDNILFEIDMDAVRYENADEVKKSTLTGMAIGIGSGYYYPLISNSVELFCKLLAGGVYTSATFDENLTDKNSVSIDIFVMAGAGVRVYLSDSFFIDPSFSWKTVFYTGALFHDAGISLGCGLKF